MTLFIFNIKETGGTKLRETISDPWEKEPAGEGKEQLQKLEQEQEPSLHGNSNSDRNTQIKTPESIDNDSIKVKIDN